MLVAVQCASARPAARFNASGKTSSTRLVAQPPHQGLASVLQDARLDFCEIKKEETREPAQPLPDSSGNLIRRIRHQRADAFQEGLRLHRPKTSNWLKDQLNVHRVACLRDLTVDCCK